MAKMEAFVFVGLLLGSLCSIAIYTATSASTVFACAALSTFLGLVYLYFFVNESILEISTEETTAYVSDQYLQRKIDVSYFILYFRINLRQFLKSGMCTIYSIPVSRKENVGIALLYG